MITIEGVRDYFKNELYNENYTRDRNGGLTIELLGASFLADEDSIFGVPNKEYISAEIDWYNSKSTNINDIHGDEKPAPKAWQMTANTHGEINSNYGRLIFGAQYHKQYKQVLNELLDNEDSRRASMIYTRPSIWTEYDKNGKNDFICTNSVTYYIRDECLHCVVQMRSNDVVFGYKNDYAWQKHVLEELREDLYYNGVETEIGDIHWQVQNLHVYEKHFDLVNEE